MRNSSYVLASFLTSIGWGLLLVSVYSDAALVLVVVAPLIVSYYVDAKTVAIEAKQTVSMVFFALVALHSALLLALWFNGNPWLLERFKYLTLFYAFMISAVLVLLPDGAEYGEKQVD